MSRINFESKRWLIAPLGAMAAVAVAGFAARQSAVAAANESGVRQPVLVELFTSEGCSSCPPADALLTRLDATQPVAGAQVIVLSEHVTYWDHLGWRDPFSLEAMTEHQQQYSARFGLDDVYTPQAVVDGAAQLVGSDERGLRRAVEQAAAAPKEELSIDSAELSGDSVQFSVRGGANTKSRKTMLIAALAQDSAQSTVARGENAGRSLRHVAVVRAMKEMGRDVEDGRALTLKASGTKLTEPVRLVVFLADSRNGHVLAVAERTIGRP